MKHLKENLWHLLAAILSAPAMVDWLIRRAMRTPYLHIKSPDGKDIYMYRYWLFNPYPADEAERERRKKHPTIWDKLPSIRLHHIMREDRDRDMHDHPWDARTIILRGWYMEDRLEKVYGRDEEMPHDRLPGDTATLKYGEYHRITCVSPGGVWTLFITWKYRGTWGFLVNGVKVPWRQYLGSGSVPPTERLTPEAKPA